MAIDHQRQIFEIIKREIKGKDSLGNVVGDILNISQDAVYRRYRGETHLTINEMEKLSRAFSISIDNLFALNRTKILFDFQPLNLIDFSMDGYLENICNSILALKSQKAPSLIMTINNTPFLQLLNFPHLVRFKLFFWAKTHLQLKEYEKSLFKYEKISERTFQTGVTILKNYVTIPSKEIYDLDLLRGFAREIVYYYESQLFEDANDPIHLLNKLTELLNHLQHQAEEGRKFIYGTATPAFGNEFEMYFNETLNASTSYYYSTDNRTGLFISHNLMNTIHTSDPTYSKDSKQVLDKQLATSSIISKVNEKERNSYFFKIRNMIEKHKKRIELDMSI
jgi:hypothetical protein